MFVLLTQLGFLLLTISYTVSSLVTLWYNCKEKNASSLEVAVELEDGPNCEEGAVMDVPEELPAKWHHKVMWLIQGTITNIATLIVVLFWSLLGFHSHGFGEVINLTTHGFNMVFLIVDLLLSSFPIRLLHVVYPLVFVLCYLISSIVIFYVNGEGLYGMLIYTPGYAGKITGIWFGVLCVLVPLIQLILYALYKLRLLLVKKFKGQQ